MRDLYAVLGLPRDADQATIRKQYKRLARDNHPDLNKDPAAAERFKEINAAHEVLGDEQKRALYDEFGEVSLRPGFNADQARQWKSAGFGGPTGGFGDFGGGVEVDDLLGSLFGGRGRGRRARNSGPRQGADIEATIEVDLLSALRGDETIIEVRHPTSCGTCSGSGGTGRSTCPGCRGTGRKTLSQLGSRLMMPCSECGGTGHVFSQECPTCAGTGRTMVTERLKVHIPAGVADGQVVRLRGKGGEGVQGGPPGDLLIQVGVRPHPWLRREGDDLTMDVPITLTEAIAGGRIEVPTIDGSVRVTVPPGSVGGRKMRLRGKGAGGRGDLFLVLRPTPPATVDPDALRLAAELDRFQDTDVRGELKL